MKKIWLILFLIFGIVIQSEAGQIPENLTPITIDNIDDLQPILVAETDYSAAIYDVAWYEDEDTTAIIFAGVSGLCYIDLNADDITPTQLESSTVYGFSINYSPYAQSISK